jgi:hypothetical protein
MQALRGPLERSERQGQTAHLERPVLSDQPEQRAFRDLLVLLVLLVGQLAKQELPVRREPLESREKLVQRGKQELQEKRVRPD